MARPSSRLPSPPLWAEGCHADGVARTTNSNAAIARRLSLPPVKLHCFPAASPSPAALSFSSHWAESRGRHVDLKFVVLIDIDIANTANVRHRSLPKFHCSMLAEDAIKAAVSDYKQKQAKANIKRAADVTATPAATATVQTAA